MLGLSNLTEIYCALVLFTFFVSRSFPFSSFQDLLIVLRGSRKTIHLATSYKLTMYTLH